MKRKLIPLLLSVFAAIPAAAQLRITEICPQPATTHQTTGEVIDQLDPNGKVSGWIELENTSATDTVDLANYQLVRTHRGKKVKDKPYSPDNQDNDGSSMLPSRQILPGQRVLVYTSDEYDNDEEVDGLGLIVKEYETPGGGSMIVLPSKVNPKRYPMIQLYDYTSGSGVVVDRFLIPVDLPKGYSFVPGPDSIGRTNYVPRTVVSTSNVLSRTQSWTADEALAWREPLADDEAAAAFADGDWTIAPSVVVRASASDTNGVERLDALDYADAVPSADWLAELDATNALASAESVSVALWFCAQPDAAPPAGGFVSLFDARTQDSASAPAVSLWLDAAGALVADRGGSAVGSAAGGLFDGTWHHVALILGRAADARYAVYLDGAAVVDTAAGVSGAAATAPDEPSVIFTGVEIRPTVFARALDATEIAARNLLLLNNDTEHGGFCRPENLSSDNAETQRWKTGIPCLVMLRPDGTVAGRLFQFNNVSPGDTSALGAYLERMNELVALCDEPAEEDNADWRTTADVLETNATVEVSLSALDRADWYRLPPVAFLADGAFSVKATTAASDTTMMREDNVQVALWRVGETTNEVASAKGSLFSGVTLPAALAADGADWYVAVKAIDSSKTFLLERAETSVTGYALTADLGCHASAPVFERAALAVEEKTAGLVAVRV